VLLASLGEARWNHGGNASLTANEPSTSSILVLKDARTGSTWFCLEMNERGQHIQQESLLNWDRELDMLKIPKDEHLSRSSRAAWVEQSLLRPMPKNPYAIQASCAPPANAVLENGRHLSEKMGNVDAVKKEVCDSLEEVGICAPPYTSNACADLHGCFQQDTLQRTCYHKAGVSPPRAVVQLCRARSVMQSSSAKMRS